MRKASTIFARLVVYIIGAAAIAVLTVLLPELAREEAIGKPSDLAIPFLTVAYILAIPFFIALYQSHKLLDIVDSNKAFSKESVKALQIIKICSIVFSILIVSVVVGGIIMAKVMDPTEDVTFMVTLGSVFAFIPAVIAVFVAVLKKLLAEAVFMKSENDLIV